jgi:protein disulfide-isomerase A6
LGAVNCDTQRKLCSEHGVKSYPTLKAVVPGSGKGSWKLFKGERTAKAVSDWAISLVPNHVAEVADEAGLAKLLARCSGGGSKREAVADRASWDVCVVLVTDKSTTPVSYKSLSK